MIFLIFQQFEIIPISHLAVYIIIRLLCLLGKQNKLLCHNFCIEYFSHGTYNG